MTEVKAKGIISKGLAVMAVAFALAVLSVLPYWIGHFMFAISNQEDLVDAFTKWGNGFGFLCVVSAVVFILGVIIYELGKFIESKL